MKKLIFLVTLVSTSVFADDKEFYKVKAMIELTKKKYEVINK
jgi:hypothetical protein